MIDPHLRHDGLLELQGQLLRVVGKGDRREELMQRRVQGGPEKRGRMKKSEELCVGGSGCSYRRCPLGTKSVHMDTDLGPPQLAALTAVRTYSRCGTTAPPPPPSPSAPVPEAVPSAALSPLLVTDSTAAQTCGQRWI